LKRPRRAVIDAGLLIDATMGWFLLQRDWSWISIRTKTRVRYLSSADEIRVIVQYLQSARLHASTYGLAELGAAVEKHLPERERAEFYETMLSPLLDPPGTPGVREHHRPAKTLIAEGAAVKALPFGLPDIAAWELARRMCLPLMTEDRRLAELCSRSGIDTWNATRLLAPA